MTLEEIEAMPVGLDAVYALLDYINGEPVDGAYHSNLVRHHVAGSADSHFLARGMRNYREPSHWKNPEFIRLLGGPLGKYICEVRGAEGAEMDARITTYNKNSRQWPKAA